MSEGHTFVTLQDSDMIRKVASKKAQINSLISEQTPAHLRCHFYNAARMASVVLWLIDIDNSEIIVINAVEILRD